MTKLRQNKKTGNCFLIVLQKLTIETLIEEVGPTDVEDFNIDYRELSRLGAFTVYFELSAFRQKEQNRFLPFE